MSLKRADKFSIVSVTVEDSKKARALSEKLLKAKLCACVQIIPKISSLYWWKGKIIKSEENLMIIKTHQSRMRDLMQMIEENHDYDIPEVIEVKPGLGSSKYMDWIMSTLDIQSP
jgi:periplasmic divalent cation tolerance protein